MSVHWNVGGVLIKLFTQTQVVCDVDLINTRIYVVGLALGEQMTYIYTILSLGMFLCHQRPPQSLRVVQVSVHKDTTAVDNVIPVTLSVCAGFYQHVARRHLRNMCLPIWVDVLVAVNGQERERAMNQLYTLNMELTYAHCKCLLRE